MAPAREKPSRGTRAIPAAYDATVADLLAYGLMHPGTTLHKRYLGHELTARVEDDGRIRFGDKIYNSLSIAAGAARVSVKGPPADGRRYYQTNGWTFWEFENENGRRQPIQKLRERLIRERPQP